MAVGSMLINNRSFVQVGGPPVTLTLNNAPAKDALMSLARLGGYGFVFVADTGIDVDAGIGAGGDSSEYPVTMAFRNERYDRALNSVLMASGLQGRLDGGTLLVGTAVSAKSFGPQMSKVFRLNQVDAESASRYLGNLGAIIKIANTSTTTSRESESSGTSSNSSETTKSTTVENSVVDTYSSGVGPLLGLVGTTDSRLNTITLVGDPSLISVAQSYLRQIDLRKRQVAVKVQILNVRLEDNSSIDSSFSAKIGDTFIVSQSGKAHMNFGKYKPGGSAGTGIFNGENGQIPGAYQESSVAEIRRPKPPVVPLAESTEIVRLEDEDGNLTGYEVVKKPLLVDGQEVFVPSANPNEAKDLVPVYDKYGRAKLVPKKELNRYKANSFYSYIESVVVSSNAKTLAQPTLLVQEGEKASVRSGISVITGVNKTEGANGSTSFSNTREDAGLTVDLEIEKIDDNGFITLKLDPTIAVPVSAGVQEGVEISDINKRELKSGRIRLRDQQTLILTGVIQEEDRALARKWPILGDLPLLGQLFRSSSRSRAKNELVIIVTPSILDDENGGAYGYGYRPGTEEATRLIGAGSGFTP
ncbi:type II and III secretion system protein [Synechococcus sp. MU1617]|nr:type II and III secretion system protein [Synechococcus sp. MU1617]